MYRPSPSKRPRLSPSDPEVRSDSPQIPPGYPDRSTIRTGQVVYVVLQRASGFGPTPEEEHDVSCVSVHTTLSAANKAAKYYMALRGEYVEEEDGWESWEDLVGTRVQTDSGGRLRIITKHDNLSETLAWVEEKVVQDGVNDDSGSEEGECVEENKDTSLLGRGDSAADAIDLTED